MASWAMRKRYEWISDRLEAAQPFTRDDIVEAFTVTKQTVSTTIAQFIELNPGALRYCRSRKAFVRADTPPFLSSVTRREATVIDALKRLTIAARTTGGVAGLDPELMAACEQAERALAKAETALVHSIPEEGQ